VCLFCSFRYFHSATQNTLQVDGWQTDVLGHPSHPHALLPRVPAIVLPLACSEHKLQPAAPHSTLRSPFLKPICLVSHTHTQHPCLGGQHECLSPFVCRLHLLLLTALPASPFMLLMTGRSVCLSDKKLNTALLCAACAAPLHCAVVRNS
jgi:hypothetical protein